MSATSEKIRRDYTEIEKKRDQGLRMPADVLRYDNIPFGRSKRWNVLDVLRPFEDKGSRPVIIYVHGGEWVYADKLSYQYFCISLAQRGFIVVDFNIHLAPEKKYPEQLVDVNLAVKWTLKNGDIYGMDLDNIFMMGDSSGAQLCAQYVEMCTNPDFAAKFDIALPEGFVPKAVALNCGIFAPFGQTPLFGAEADAELMTDVLPGNDYAAETALFNAVTPVTAAFPPTFVLSCHGDPWKAFSEEFVQKLSQEQVPHEYKVYGSEVSPLYHNFQLDIRNTAAIVSSDDECAFFRKFVK